MSLSIFRDRHKIFQEPYLIEFRTKTFILLERFMSKQCQHKQQQFCPPIVYDMGLWVNWPKQPFAHPQLSYNKPVYEQTRRVVNRSSVNLLGICNRVSAAICISITVSTATCTSSAVPTATCISQSAVSTATCISWTRRRLSASA